MNKRSTGLLLLLASLTLGLAPFRPEPHLFANLRWIAGGAVGMQLENWLDTLMHGAPVLLLLIWCAYVLIGFLRKGKDRSQA